MAHSNLRNGVARDEFEEDQTGVAATVGASAVVAMGTLTAVLSDDSGSATVVSDPEMTLGETSTIEKAATEVETSVGGARGDGRAA